MRELRASEYAPRHILRLRQEDRLRQLARWAYDTVPAYRRRFDESGIRPHEIGTAADLERLPVLTKRDLQAHGADFWSVGAGRDRHWTHLTSGSTGEPLRAVRDLALRPVGQGTWWHVLERCGVHPADPMIDIASHHRPWRASWRKRLAALTGSLPVTAAMLVRNDVDAINTVLRGWRPRLISGQPHRIAQLARLVLEGRVRLSSPPQAVSYHGTILSDDARAVIAAAFRAPIHSRYAAIEFVPPIAYTCEQGWFHVNAHHFIVEILSGGHGEQAAPAAGAGRVVITDLTNLIAPYLRYELGDIAAWAPDEPCPCGRTWPRFAAIFGRETEAAVTASDREISQSILAREMFMAAPELPDVVWEYQFRQHALENMELCVVPRPGFSGAHAARLTAALDAFAGGEIRFRVSVVDEIPAGPGEKRPLLVNLITPEAAARRSRTEA